ncbi:MAG: PIG-L family deacetylase [Ginsengibacter sp.]
MKIKFSSPSKFASKKFTVKFAFVSMILLLGNCELFSQTTNSSLFKVLTLNGTKQGAKDLAQDHGFVGIWQRLKKLQNTASVLTTQAHPDDEDAGLLNFLSRGMGYRTALLSLNRGEGGGNVLGAEAFDALGLIRTEELLMASGYYGLDDLYFTRLVDYGFSKRVDEAYEKWGKENILAETVRCIRINRPTVIVSRFNGSERDGHGNHQAAGEISQLAWSMAGDSNAFPDQITKEHLQPWKALKFYRGGVNPNEHWNIKINTGIFDPLLGTSYKNFGARGYSFHRSQFGGQLNLDYGASINYYERLFSKVKGNEKEKSFFDGIDTTITGIFSLTGEAVNTSVEPLLINIQEDVTKALHEVKADKPESVLPFLINGLSKTRAAVKLLNGQPNVLFLLKIKERQFEDVINEILGIHLEALAVPVNTKADRNAYEPPPTMGFAVQDRPFKVEALFVNNSHQVIKPVNIKLVSLNNCSIESTNQDLKRLAFNEKIVADFKVTIPANTPFSEPYFNRKSIQESAYRINSKEFENLPWQDHALNIEATYLLNGELITLTSPVEVFHSRLPYGYDRHILKVAPAIAVNIKPSVIVVPKNQDNKSFSVDVQLVNNVDSIVHGELTIKAPTGWIVEPLLTKFSFTKAGEKNTFSIKITMPAILENNKSIEAVATVRGKQFSLGYNLTSYPDLDQTISYHPAQSSIKTIDVNVAPDLNIGYIMGVGDEVPRALEQLGAKVQLLNTSDLSTAGLNKFDVVMIGTRAYAVRPDLNTYNYRLLEYARQGGHLIVLFQTPEFVPERMAPFHAVLPSNSEEISEENSPVTILNAAHPVLSHPNKITLKDFDNWVEQRGSKFFSAWDKSYIPIISTFDKGQAPQKGGWLMANYGKGCYTYCAYSFHRQLPYGIEGPYRILANLISYGKQ